MITGFLIGFLVGSILWCALLCAEYDNVDPLEMIERRVRGM